MIVKISKGTFVKGVIQYNEKKVLNGEAELISNNTLEDSTSGKIKAFQENFALNSKVTKNKFMHFAFSVSPSEHLSTEQFFDVAKDYLEKMGFTDVPELMYRHYDKNHEHIHVICSSIQYSGKKVEEYQDFIRGKKICRELEQKYNLQITQEKGGKDRKLSEINAENYSLYAAINRANGKYDIKAEYPSGQFSNEDFIKLHGIESYNKLYSDLNRNGYVYKTDKMKLMEQLEYLYNTSTNHDSFLKKAQDNAIYVRVLNNKQVTYGIGDSYFSEKQIPQKYHFKNLQLHYGSNSLDTDSQKKDLFVKVSKALKGSISYAEFKNTLAFNKVNVHEATNSGGVYGLSFSLENGQVFKASEVNRKFSFGNILKQLQLNSEAVKPIVVKSKIQPKPKVNIPQNVPSAKGSKFPNSPLISTDDSEEKRKRKKKNMDDDMELR